MRRMFVFVICMVCMPWAVAQKYPGPIRALAQKGITIMGPLPAPKGFRGYVGRFGDQLTPVYLLPDGRHVTIGVLYDARGRDLTNAAFRAATSSGPAPGTWERLSESRWFAEGPTHPDRIVYVFTDTECTYCHDLWLAVQPYLRQGHVQMRSILVAVIAPQSLTRGAAVLASRDPALAMRRNEAAFGHSPVTPLVTVPDAIRGDLMANQRLMNSLDAFATPAIVYRDAGGRVHMTLGVPDASTLNTIFGMHRAGRM